MKVSRLTVFVLAAAVTAALTAGAAPASGASQAKVTLRSPGAGSATVGATYGVRGRLLHVGPRNDKTIILQTQVIQGGPWLRLRTKRHMDAGRFGFGPFSATAAGVRSFRVLVKQHGRMLGRSPVRALLVTSPPVTTTVPAPTAPVTTPIVPDTADPGQAGPTSNIATRGVATMADFLNAIHGNVRTFWNGVWAQYNLAAPTDNWYWPPTDTAFYHACNPTGVYVDNTAAAYCPRNDYIIIAQPFAVQLWEGQVSVAGGAVGQAHGDFSVAYAVAHEYAHNLQWELDLFNKNPGLPTRAFELHADCWAGIWANSAYYAGILQAGDIQEALGTAAQLGNGDFWDPNFHGTSEQRQSAFLTGYNSGQPPACNVWLVP